MVKSKELENYNEITLPKSEKEKKTLKGVLNQILHRIKKNWNENQKSTNFLKTIIYLNNIHI